MSIAENIKTLREDKGLMQKEVYNDIGLKPAHYNKLDAKPQTVTIEDKSSVEQLRLISQLNDKDKCTVMNIIDTILTK